MEEIKTKVCRKCGRELPLSEFYKKSTSKDGLQSNCKECSTKMSSECAKKSRERKKARNYEGELVFKEVKVTEHRINLSKLE